MDWEDVVRGALGVQKDTQELNFGIAIDGLSQ
jgi:hypothetical protein